MERASEAAVGTLHNKKTPADKGRGLRVTFSKRGWTGLTGLEPATSGVTDRHSNPLSYSPQPQAPHGAPEYRPAVRSIQRRLTLERVLDRRLCPLVLGDEPQHLIRRRRMHAPAQEQRALGPREAIEHRVRLRAAARTFRLGHFL